MTKRFSPSTKGFYTEGLNSTYPKDAVVVTEDEVLQILTAFNSNKTISVINGVLSISQDSSVDIQSILEYFSNKLQNHLDNKAKEYGYDNIYTAISYAEEPSVLKFQLEGKAFRAWRSLFWLEANLIKSEIESGSRSIPSSVEELIIELPKLNLEQSSL